VDSHIHHRGKSQDRLVGKGSNRAKEAGVQEEGRLISKHMNRQEDLHMAEDSEGEDTAHMDMMKFQ